MPRAGSQTYAAADPVVGVSWSPTDRARLAEELTHATLAPDAPTQRLHELVRAAAVATGSTTAQVSMMIERQVAVAIQHNGPGEALTPVRAGRETPFEETICALTLRADTSIAIADTQQDPRVSSLPAVSAGVVGAYLGAPIRSAGGGVLGVLCVYDASPRDWSDADVEELARLAGAVSTELHRIAGVTSQ